MLSSLVFHATWYAKDNRWSWRRQLAWRIHIYCHHDVRHARLLSVKFQRRSQLFHKSKNTLLFLTKHFITNRPILWVFLGWCITSTSGLSSTRNLNTSEPTGVKSERPSGRISKLRSRQRQLPSTRSRNFLWNLKHSVYLRSSVIKQ